MDEKLKGLDGSDGPDVAPMVEMLREVMHLAQAAGEQ